MLFSGSLKLVTGEYPPFTGQTLEHFGASTEVVSAVLEQAGLKAEYQFEPWKRGYHMVKNHVVMGTFPYAITPERAKEMLFSEPINYVENRFFYKSTHIRDVPFDWTVERMQHYKIGVPLGYATKEYLESMGLNPMVFSNEDELFMALERGDVDFAAFSEIPGWAFIRKHFGRHVRLFAAMEKPFSQDKLHMMVSKKDPEAVIFLKKFNSGLKKIRKSGIYAKIMRKYRVRKQNLE